MESKDNSTGSSHVVSLVRILREDNIKMKKILHQYPDFTILYSENTKLRAKIDVLEAQLNTKDDTMEDKEVDKYLKLVNESNWDENILDTVDNKNMLILMVMDMMRRAYSVNSNPYVRDQLKKAERFLTRLHALENETTDS